MTAVLDTPPVEETSARAAITPGDAWRKARVPVGLGLLLVAVAVLQAVLTGNVGAGYLDPEAAQKDGGLALATLLRNHGIAVERVSAPSGTPGTTVFVPVPELVLAVRPGALSDTRTATDLVLAGPDESALEIARIDAGVAGETSVRVREPSCSHPDAVAAGAARMGGATFAAGENATACYPSGDGATFVEIDDDGRRVTLLGSGWFMTNERLDDDGNAALALRLLTRNPRLEWVYPRMSEIVAAGGGGESPLSLLPHRLFVLLAQVLVVLLLLALWRARRLGPVVTEPLPVVVRAAETVEGRARLYESARRRDQAANALRAGLRDRLVRVLGLAPDASSDTIVAAVSARSTRDSVAVTDLLYGAPPTDDAALVRLAADLDRLDSEVRAL